MATRRAAGTLHRARHNPRSGALRSAAHQPPRHVPGLLFAHFLTFHTHPGCANRLTDVLAAALIEFKAFDLFSMLFGVGVAIQAERAAAHGIPVRRFLARRFLVLLALGLCHMFLIWNGDILVLYAVCGLLLLPFLRLSPRWLAFLGVASIASSLFLPWGGLFPSWQELPEHATRATRIYAQGGFGDILVFRFHETLRFILPLLLATLPKVCGLMLWGAAVWRTGLLRQPAAHRKLLWTTVIIGLITGGATTALQFRPFASDIPLALAYGSAMLLVLSVERTRWWTPFLAAAGQMALTNYLAQSIILGFIFYGYGFGLFGKLGPAAGALIAIALYACQLLLSRWWLRRCRFGPFEWIWRSLTYGHRQPMRRT